MEEVGADKIHIKFQFMVRKRNSHTECIPMTESEGLERLLGYVPEQDTYDTVFQKFVPFCAQMPL